MSILLDAVTRNKQQQQLPLPDAVMTPRANYPQPRKSGMPIGKVSLFVVAIAAGIGVAWGVSVWEQTRRLQSDMVTVTNVLPSTPSLSSSTTVNKEIKSPSVASDSQVQALLDTEPSRALSGVRLAGKVALPRAQILPEFTASSQFQLAMAPHSPQVEPSVNMHATATTQTQEHRDLGANDSSYGDYMSTSAQVGTVSRNAETIAVQPMMLGANANQSGLASLEALRQQVSAAAEDVGLETNKSRDEDKLVASFQNALKDVEYTNAAQTNVTEAKLDPIPKTATDDIPKYGQLPAGMQLQVPEFNIVAHVYSSDPSQRWLNVDGAELQEGDMIVGKLKIISIRPRDIVLDIQGTQFKVPAI
ncbi:MAG: general secretion pathway protein GspB [Shewanella sp.]